MNTAILRYSGAPIQDPPVQVAPTSLNPLNEVTLRPLVNPAAVSLRFSKSCAPRMS